MPAIDLTNPDVIKFFIENYEKTARLRMKWNTIHGDKLKQAATLNREEKGYYEADVLKEAMAAGLATLKRDGLSGARNKRTIPIRDAVHIPALADLRKGHSIVEVGLGDPKEDPRLNRPETDLSPDPVMRPIDPQQKDLIYMGIPQFGRKVYIKERDRIMPERKYYFRQTSGAEYGWRLRDSYFNNNAPQYGRVWHLTRDSKSRSGPQPDPAHYKQLTYPGPCKFC